MAYYFIFPETDTTLYSHPDRDHLNTGRDEILEIVKERGSTNNFYYPSRALLKFKNEDIKDVIREKISHETFNSNVVVNLQLMAATPQNVNQTINLETFAVSSSWDEGTGRFSNLPTSSNGASWVYRNNTTIQTAWTDGKTELSIIEFDSRLTSDAGVFTSSLQNDSFGGSGSIYITDAEGTTSTLTFSSSVAGNTLAEATTGISGTLYPIMVDVDPPATFSSSANQLAIDTARTINTIPGFSASYTDNLTYVFASSSGDTVNTTTTFQRLPGVDAAIAAGYNILYVTASVDPARDGVSTAWAAGTTGSLNESLWNGTMASRGGGNWYTGSEFYSTQQFLVGDSLDLDMDVTKIVKKWSESLFNDSTYPTGVSNNGFIIKSPDSVEESISSSFGAIQFFSVDTHTIYPPKLTFKWDDSSFIDAATGSAKSADDELSVNLYNNKEEYNQNDVARFRVHIRDKYPTRQFASSSNYLNINYFPTSSHYSIRDAYTEQEIIPFDHNYTKLSADEKGMYFNIYMKGLQPERYYRVLFRFIDAEGFSKVYDNDYYFKVVR